MSAWRKKAIACLPQLKKEFENPHASIYSVFIELLPATITAHRNNDIEQLEKNYDFAEWCFKQKAKNLWNAAGVAFYEHLGDNIETRDAMPQWVSRDIYNQIRPLLEQRLDNSSLKIIDNRYGFHKV
ncbi:hypothetical protein PV783_32625 [Chitinophaga sp. CC14]|uniref:DUF7674 family protein n=1 Tax=Chitinophaga sp. CC14 TaxID=3029199 RepID=UPI003B7CBE6D